MDQSCQQVRSSSSFLFPHFRIQSVFAAIASSRHHRVILDRPTQDDSTHGHLTPFTHSLSRLFTSLRNSRYRTATVCFPILPFVTFITLPDVLCRPMTPAVACALVLPLHLYSPLLDAPPIRVYNPHPLARRFIIICHLCVFSKPSVCVLSFLSRLFALVS